jgi:hypothetical protein
VTVEDVAPTTAESDVMDATQLLPGEYVASWKVDSQRLVVERAGHTEMIPASTEAHP